VQRQIIAVAGKAPHVLFFHILISIISNSGSLPLVYGARQIIEAVRQSTTDSIFHILISIINTCSAFSNSYRSDGHSVSLIDPGVLTSMHVFQDC
jgi:hypothetical protein